MWQLLGFGDVGTPERRYALLDPSGVIRWTGASVEAAMQFIVGHGLEPLMERDPDGECFVREQDPPAPPRPAGQDAPPGRSGAR